MVQIFLKWICYMTGNINNFKSLKSGMTFYHVALLSTLTFIPNYLGSLVLSRHNPFKSQFPPWTYKSSLIHFVQASSKLALGGRWWDGSFSSILSILFYKADKRPLPHYIYWCNVKISRHCPMEPGARKLCTKPGSVGQFECNTRKGLDL